MSLMDGTAASLWLFPEEAPSVDERSLGASRLVISPSLARP